MGFKLGSSQIDAGVLPTTLQTHLNDSQVWSYFYSVPDIVRNVTIVMYRSNLAMVAMRSARELSCSVQHELIFLFCFLYY